MKFCAECGFAMQSTFIFCPSCGAKSVVPSGSREATSRATSNTASSSRETTPTARPSSSSFDEFKKRKQADSTLFRKKGSKKQKTPLPVTIQVGVMNPDESLRRGETLPLKVLPTASAEEIREAAVLKHKAFNRKFSAKKRYKLVFRDGSEVRVVPGTDPEEPFTLERYKEDSGFSYARVVLYLMEKEHFIDALKRVIKDDYESDDDEVQGEDIGDGDAPVVTSEHCDKSNYERINTVDRGRNPEIQVLSQSLCSNSHSTSDTSANSGVPLAESSTSPVPYGIECPTCFGKFPITEIANHADVCAQSLFSDDYEDIDVDDPFTELPTPLTELPTTSSATVHDNKAESIKLAIESLRTRHLQLEDEPVRITVRRKCIWEDYRRARKVYYNPSNLLKVTFSTEPAIDDGGPKREFFAGNITNIILSSSRLSIRQNACAIHLFS